LAEVCQSALVQAQNAPVGYGARPWMHAPHCSDLKNFAQTGERSALALHEFPFGGTRRKAPAHNLK
jgi:hypothetical protein